jgi:hypothetical protein
VSLYLLLSSVLGVQILIALLAVLGAGGHRFGVGLTRFRTSRNTHLHFLPIHYYVPQNLWLRLPYKA